jgi:Fe-S-cluster containining protein
MRSVDIKDIDNLPGRRLREKDSFYFKCHSGLSCFNQCCRNLNLFLYPYDVLRLKTHLNISSDQFIDQYVDIILRESNYFPEVLLRMSENNERTCPFLTESGCSVYPDRPDACRTFPVEQGMLFDAKSKKTKLIHFFRPPDFCQGQYEESALTPEEWARDQDAVFHNKMTSRWADIKGLFQNDPWGTEGPYGTKGKMAFMAAYNSDSFREFVFNSSFLTRYKVKSSILKKIKTDEVELMKFGFTWIKFFIWGIKTKQFRLR